MSGPVTRIATFRFHSHVTAAQKADRASAFLALYAQHPELIFEGPKGGRPLDTPLELTGVSREKEWDLGFVVVFKDEEARRSFDSDPGHESLKVSEISKERMLGNDEIVLMRSRMRRIRCWRGYLCMTLLKKKIWGGEVLGQQPLSPGRIARSSYLHFQQGKIWQ